MVHLWVRAEPDPRDERVALMPDGARALVRRGIAVTVERSRTRVVPVEPYRLAGCTLAPEGSWPAAPREAVILGLGLPADGIPLVHRHATFGPGSGSGSGSGEASARRRLVERFQQGGGTFHDLAALTDQSGVRLVDLGYWEGYAAAAVAVRAWLAQSQGGLAGPLDAYPSAAALVTILSDQIERAAAARPSVLLTGALGRPGTGAADLCDALALPLSRLDLDGRDGAVPPPDPLGFDIFLDGIGDGPGLPAPLPPEASRQPRRLAVVGRLAGLPGDFGSTDWDTPARRLHGAPPLDLVAPAAPSALLPAEASRDLAAQILPALMDLDAPGSGTWSHGAAASGNGAAGDSQ